MVVEQSRAFSQEQVNNIVASEVTKHRLGDLEVKISSLETSMASLFAKLEASLQAVSVQIEKSAVMVKECRDDLKQEIDREYATKLELTKLEAKVDKMWAKITVAVTFAVAFVQIALAFFGIV